MLRSYQADLYDRSRQALLSCRGVCIVAPCRSGKSYIMLEIVRNAMIKHSSVLILAHRNILLDQHRRLITEGARIESVFTEVNHLGEHGKVDLIIIDEAHLSGCESYQKVCSYYSNAKIIGFTATPSRLDGKPLNLFQQLIIGVSADDLINRGYIAPYDLFAPKMDIDLSKVTQSCGDFNNSELGEVMTDRKIYGDIVSNYLKYAGDRKAIAYCVNVRHAIEMRDLFESNEIPAVEIDAGTSESDREKALAEFSSGKYRILCNCNLISEGITLPEADCCLLLRPTQSLTLYIQQSNRCLTPREGKRAVIIDYVGNCFTHGMPTDSHEWSLTEDVRTPNRSREPDVLVRICNECYRAYPASVGRICPYCNHDNGKTKKEIEDDKKAELERITDIKKKDDRIRQGRAKSLEELIKVGKERGYRNPWAWANFVMNGRKRK